MMLRPALRPPLRAPSPGALALREGVGASIIGQQWGAKQNTGSAASAFTYHQTFTVEVKAKRFRFLLLNTNTNAMTVSAGAVAVSDKLGTGAERYTPSTGAWLPITWDGGSTSVVVPAGALDRPARKWSDWISIETLPCTDGDLPVVMTRFYLPTGAFSIGTFSFAPWAATSGINDGRFLFMFRDVGDFASGSHGSLPGNAYNNLMLMGFEYEAAERVPVYNFLVSGDSIAEGAVNGSSGNFGNGWAWQTIVALRAANPGVAIGYRNNGITSSGTATFLNRYNDVVAAGEAFNALLHLPFSPNDGAPTSGIIASASSRLDAILAAAAGKKTVLLTPCVNTASAWNTTADGFRLTFRTTVQGKASGTLVQVADIEAALSDGATPARFQVSLTTDGTHPNETGCAAIVDVVEPLAQALLPVA